MSRKEAKHSEEPEVESRFTVRSGFGLVWFYTQSICHGNFFFCDKDDELLE